MNMNGNFSAGMAEATQMTQSGRLAEATALIQRLLNGGAADSAPAAPDIEITPPPRAEAKPRDGLRETLRRLAERARAIDVLDPAVAPPPDGARFATATHRSAAGSRDYKLYVPANRPDGPMPLVVMLHGCTQNPDDFARGTCMNALAEEFGVLVAWPAQPGSANQNRCWNWFRPEDQRREAGEPSLIAGIVRDVIASENVDASRVYVAGMSAGGAMAAVLGAEYPELFAAIGVHSGLPQGAARDLPSALMAMRQGAGGDARARLAPSIVFHGDADHVVSPRNGEGVAAQARAAGVTTPITERGQAGGRGYSRAVHADASGRTLCEHWTVSGAGHVWSGGDASGSHTDAQGPNASREMLRFFLSHQR